MCAVMRRGFVCGIRLSAVDAAASAAGGRRSCYCGDEHPRFSTKGTSF